jgi:3-mercaptopyruvate sulfurtransferase SseA
MKKFRDFESAREFARKLGLKNQKEWIKYCKSGNKPDDIPSNANTVYKNYFKGMIDWLGNEYRDFESAREFARKLGLKNQKEWIEYCKSGEKPDDIPSSPLRVYKNKGWISMGDWLGTGRTQYSGEYLQFKEAREFVRSLEIKSVREWIEYCASGNKPQDIPTTPSQVYKKDWKGWGNFLGTGIIAPKDKVFRSFTEAREFVRSLKLKNYKEWIEYCTSGNKPQDIPTTPNQIYKKDWKGWGNFLGTGIIAPKNMSFRSFTEAREFVRSLGLKTQKEWQEYCKSGDKPDNIPVNPNKTYIKEWEGLGDWLGTGNVAPKDKVFRSFTEAREFVRSLGLKTGKEWQEYCKSGDKPEDIPSNPQKIYKNNGWKKK